MDYVITDVRITPKFMKPSTPGSNAIDLRACIDMPITLAPTQQLVIKCGIKIELDSWQMGMILPRSGKGVAGLVLGNLVGNIDSDYRGEVMACMWNRGIIDQVIEPMDRIAQLVIIDIHQPAWKEVVALTDTSRGKSGFGSTGSK